MKNGLNTLSCKTTIDNQLTIKPLVDLYVRYWSRTKYDLKLGARVFIFSIYRFFKAVGNSNIVYDRIFRNRHFEDFFFSTLGRSYAW